MVVDRKTFFFVVVFFHISDTGFHKDEKEKFRPDKVVGEGNYWAQ